MALGILDRELFFPLHNFLKLLLMFGDLTLEVTLPLLIDCGATDVNISLRRELCWNLPAWSKKRDLLTLCVEFCGNL